MRTIEDFTEADLLALSEDAVNAIIDRECMARGIPLLPPEPVPPQEPCIEYDVIAFLRGFIKRAGQDGRGLSAEECNEIAEALSKRMEPPK